MSGIVAATLHAPLPVHVLDISNTVKPNIVALLAVGGWFGKQQQLRIINSSLVNTLEIPASLDGADITLVNASGGLIGGARNAGTAIKTRAHIKIDNAGSINGGGGGGGSGGNTNVQFQAPTYIPDVGWGYGGAGGYGQGFGESNLTIYARSFGAAGTSTGVIYGSYEGGSFGGGGEWAQAYGGEGGTGGDWGQAGDIGGSASTSGFGGYVSGGDNSGYAGQLAGYYIDGNDFVTWINTGTRLGRVLA